MKPITAMTALILSLSFLWGCTSDAGKASLGTDQEQLRHLFDKFAVLADQKDIPAQIKLFTPDAVLVSRSDGEVSELVGRDEIKVAFEAFLGQFDTVYHQNGQHIVEINGASASGTGYSTVVLGNAEMRMEMGVIYSDSYVKRDTGWLIDRRESDFVWREVTTQ